MRKRTIRNGLRMIVVALMMIVIASFYHAGVGGFFSLTYDDEMRFYRFGIFLAAVMGGYGVVLSAFGLVLPARQSDSEVRIMPALLLIVGVVSLFFYLLSASFDMPNDPVRERLRPGEAITI